MRLILEVISGPLTGKKVVAEEQQVVRIGRTNKADIATEDGFMSGEHFAVQMEAGVWHIRDLKSRNGTKVNDHRIASAELHDGDRVHAGSTDFIVHIETSESHPPRSKSDLLKTLPPAVPTGQFEIEEPVKPPATTPPKKSRSDAKKPAKSRTQFTTSRIGVTGKVAKPESTPPPVVSPVEETSIPPGPQNAAPNALDLYEAATPVGRLLRLLQAQTDPLYALVDATHDEHVLEMLKESQEQFQSLYSHPSISSSVPYLVLLPAQSALLRKMTQRGWGRLWGVYLTCPRSLRELRDYFRSELMVRLPDGVELFSRFYDPRFFRVFLDTCTPAEAEKFFGPVRSYFMEAEKPEIVLQFTRTARGVEKKGHLLTDL